MPENVLNTITSLVASKGLAVVLALVIFIIGRIVINALLKVYDRATSKGKTDPTVKSFGRNVTKAALHIVLILLILDVVGFEVTSLAAILASAGVAVGLALQGSLSNLAGGILILIMRPFKVGDFITAGGFSGTVTEIGLIYTSLVTVDNHSVMIPNGSLSADSIENFSSQPTRRVDVQIGIPYGADLKQAKAVFEKTIDALPQRLSDQPVDVFVADLGACVTLEGRVWVDSADYWTALWALRENVKEAYGEAGIPVPHTVVDVYQQEQ